METADILSKLSLDELNALARDILLGLDGVSQSYSSGSIAETERKTLAGLKTLFTEAGESESSAQSQNTAGNPLIRAITDLVTVIFSAANGSVDPLTGAVTAAQSASDPDFLTLARLPGENSVTIRGGSGVSEPAYAAADADSPLLLKSDAPRVPASLMSEVSDFFQRDSRRYDGGFERF